MLLTGKLRKWLLEIKFTPSEDVANNNNKKIRKLHKLSG